MRAINKWHFRSIAVNAKIKHKIPGIISKYVYLDKEGRVICPFCHGLNFFIVDALQVFFCTGCKRSGDVTAFFEEFRNFNHNYVMNDLEVSNVLDYTYFDGNSPHNDYIEKIVEIFTGCCYLYHSRLEDSTIKYLNELGITRDLIEQFLIGNVGEGLIANYLIKERKFPKELCIRSNLLNEEYLDNFKEGIIIPNFIKGKIIGITCIKMGEPDTFQRIWLSELIMRKGDEYSLMELLFHGLA